MVVEMVIADVDWHSILFTGVTTAGFIGYFIIAALIGLFAL